MARIKKEDIYYTLLKELATILVQAGEEYVDILDTYPDSFVQLPRMKMFETQADELVRDIMTRMYTSFITPFDRMERCLDSCDKAAGVVRNVVLKSS